ncbi:MAG: DEAD/DEAH box helicase [Bdellovibrionales bacterium]|nr:DEAD/DEAH box helicase [Bdellovibrionales bacterium]
MTFDSFNLNARVLSGVKSQGFETPTPIQAQAIPSVMDGKDLLGLAQTGTGKTAAYLLPILHKLAHGPRGRPRCLILAPTRELASQIEQDAVRLGKHTGLRCTAIFGGASFGMQLSALRQGVDIVVACPGRLLDHINRNTIRLSAINTLVLDEADHMFDMGFLPDVRRILSNLPASRQTLLFSATMPGDIQGLAEEVLSNPVKVKVGRVAPATTVSQSVYPVTQSQKTGVLLGLLKEFDAESVLIFTRTKHRAKGLAEKLGNAGHKVVSLQGNLSQNRRKSAMDGFRSGRYRILVATDIAARGIDISSITHVVNFDIPETTDAYTHRIGRTGRAARLGDAITLVTPEDRSKLKAIERIVGKELPRKKLDGFNYQQVAPLENRESRRRPQRNLSQRRDFRSRNPRQAQAGN